LRVDARKRHRQANGAIRSGNSDIEESDVQRRAEANTRSLLSLQSGFHFLSASMIFHAIGIGVGIGEHGAVGSNQSDSCLTGASILMYRRSQARFRSKCESVAPFG